MKRIIASAAVVFALSATPAHATTFKCHQWMATAVRVGFKKSDLKELDRLMYRESRCAPGARHLNKNSAGLVTSVDKGLMQINDKSWVTYLRNLGIIKSSDDLLHPGTNLKAAKALYDYSVEHGYNRWYQWRTFGSGSYAE